MLHWALRLIFSQRWKDGKNEETQERLEAEDKSRKMGKKKLRQSGHVKRRNEDCVKVECWKWNWMVQGEEEG